MDSWELYLCHHRPYRHMVFWLLMVVPEKIHYFSKFENYAMFFSGQFLDLFSGKIEIFQLKKEIFKTYSVKQTRWVGSKVSGVLILGRSF